MNIHERKQKASLLISYASLKYNNEPTDQENVIAENSRLNRILSEEYIKNDSVKEFNSFCLDWIKQNGEDFVYTDKWVYDIRVPDESHDMDVNVMINKFQKKGFYART